MTKKLVAAALLGITGAVFAQGVFPSRPVTLVVPQVIKDKKISVD